MRINPKFAAQLPTFNANDMSIQFSKDGSVVQFQFTNNDAIALATISSDKYARAMRQSFHQIPIKE